MNEVTLLHRQVHSTWLVDGSPTSLLFKPTPKTPKHVCVYDGDQITPEKSWLYHTEKLGLKSQGVMSVSCDECQNEDVSVRSDPEEFPEHVVIEFDGHSLGDIKKISNNLKVFALQRGWQYKAEVSFD